MSSQRNSRKTNGKRSGARSNTNQRMVAVLKRIERSTESDMDHMMPQVEDVPPIILSRSRTYTTSFSYTASTIANSATGVSGAISFQLGTVPDNASWTGAFDAYRIIQATVQFVPLSTPPASASSTGVFFTVLDYDDVNPPTDQSTLVQYDTLEVVQPGQYFERRLRPRPSNAMYNGSVFTSYGQVNDQWIDAASPATPHYGLKYFATPSSIGLNLYSPIVTLVVQFRDGH